MFWTVGIRNIRNAFPWLCGCAACQVRFGRPHLPYRGDELGFVQRMNIKASKICAQTKLCSVYACYFKNPGSARVWEEEVLISYVFSLSNPFNLFIWWGLATKVSRKGLLKCSFSALCWRYRDISWHANGHSRQPYPVESLTDITSIHIVHFPVLNL